MMFFSKNIKISEEFSKSYFDNLENFLSQNFETTLDEKKIIDLELVYYDFIINDKKVSIICEEMEGTSIYGKKKIIDQILIIGKKKRPDLFNLI